MSAYCTGNVFPPQRRGGGASPAAAYGRKGETYSVGWSLVGFRRDSRRGQARRIEGNMRRDGYIIEEIVATDNMKASFRSVLRGTDRKRSRVGRYLLAHEDEVIAELQQRIADGSYRVGGYREMIVMRRENAGRYR